MIDDGSYVRFTSFPNLSGYNPQQVTMAWGELKSHLAALPAKYVKKEDMPLISGMFFGNQLSPRNSSPRWDGNVLQLYMVCLDIDKSLLADGTVLGLRDAVLRLQAAGLAVVGHTTPKHTAAAPRYRLLLPMSGPQDPHQLKVLVDWIAPMLGHVVAPESWKLSQAWYLGRMVGAEYESHGCNGEAADVLLGLQPVASVAHAVAGAGAVSGGGGGVGLGAPRNPAPGPIPQGVGTASGGPAPGTRAKRNSLKNAVVARIVSMGLFIRELPDGTVQMRCPFEHEHTTPTVPGDCVYLPPHTMGYSQGHIKCMHGHCQHRKMFDFLAALNLPLATPANAPPAQLTPFWFMLSNSKFLYTPTGDYWAGDAVDSFIAPNLWPVDHSSAAMPPSRWLRANRHATQEAWLPGHDAELLDMAWLDGQLKPSTGNLIVNTWRPIPPVVQRFGVWDPSPWLDHAHSLYGVWADHLIRTLAFKLQNPGVKVNMGILLGGPPGCGKDTLLSVLSTMVGPSNWAETTPAVLLGQQFNAYVRTLFLRLNEIEALEGPARWHLMEYLKIFMASPPETLMLNRKNIAAIAIPNVLLLLMTSNHLELALAFARNDRRVFLLWTDITAEKLGGPAYFQRLHLWLANGGREAVMQYLLSLDVSTFDPNAHAPTTPEKLAVVAHSEDPMQATMADLLDAMGRPAVVSAPQLAEASSQYRIWFDGKVFDALNYRNRFAGWLRDAGYKYVANPQRNVDGKFIVNGRRTNFYSRLDDVAAAVAEIQRLAS